MDIDGWLRSIGLEQYAGTLRDNAIDADVLHDLTDAHLRELGLPLGARLKLLKAVAALPTVTPAAPETPSAAPRADAERRQLTIMFCDLVGSTALSARLDPEDMREIVGAYQRCCGDLIARSGGFVAKYMGDGVLAYFGYPQAHEHDVERAVRAGLALVEEVPKLTTSARQPLQVRVGIATGLVVVGDIIGSGEAHERGIVGDTPNLAARLQGIARPNTVVIADGTRRLLGDLFELADLGERPLKGLTGRVRAWAALRPSSVGSRFEALHTTGLTALMGREEESDLLMRRWARAKTGEGQVVLLSGEAGIGKSRLTAALLERLSGEPHTRLRYFCSPQRIDSALHPIIGQLERAAGLADHDSPRTRLDKLDALLAQTAMPPQDAALVADMLSLATDGRYPPQDLSPPQRRQRTLDVLMAQLVGSARPNPLLMIFEDVHWIDPTSLELLGRIVVRIRTLPALLLVTFRPEFNPPWIGQSHLASVSLSRLGEHDAAGIIARLVGDKALPADVLAEIVARTDGIPLFVEEMTKAVLEAGSEGGARRTLAAAPAPTLSVPPSLHASLMARLDRLGSAKEIAQVGSAIGREFSHALMALVARRPEAELRAALDRLVQAGLLFREGVPPQARYIFNHALVQDAAYGTLLRENRRALHARIAETLESQFTETAASRPEILARHFTEAGLIGKSADLWGKAALQSLARSALVESVAQFTRALEQIATLPGTPMLRREQIRLQVALITPLIHVKGYAAAETKAAADRAHQLIDQAEALGEAAEDPLLLFQVLYAFWVASYVSFDGNAMLDLAGQFLALAQKRRSTIPLMVGHRHMGLSLMMTGSMTESLVHLDQAVALYDPAEHRALSTRFSQDTGVTALFYRAWALWFLGHPAMALRDATDALRDAREIDQAATLMFALGHGAVLHLLRGNYAATAELSRELTTLAEQKDARFWKALATMNQGCTLPLPDQAATAADLLTSGMAAFRATGAKAWIPFYLPYLARAQAALGKVDEAWRCIADALSAAETTKETWCAAEIHRAAGEIALASATPEAVPDVARAEQHFQQALAISRQQNAKSWELRAATSLARLWNGHGEGPRAHDLLVPIRGWFSEGFDTLDLQQAAMLLEKIGREPTQAR